jgi:hypothetical protein
VQAAQVLVAPHIGAVAAHVALVRQPTHVFVVVSQTETPPAQVELSIHWTQAPAAEQTARVGSPSATHWLEAVQAVQVPLAQTGAATGQVALVRQPTQAPAAEQTARVGSPSATHWLEAVQAIQVPLAQTGAAAGQVALARHWTHLLVVVSQRGVVPEQSVFAVHWTQAPDVEQTARAGSPSATH